MNVFVKKYSRFRYSWTFSGENFVGNF